MKKRGKKKVKKEKVKKKISKKKNTQEPIGRKDFEAFKFGVERLKSLEAELNSMDTTGFSREAQDIRSRLKTVSEIPNVERKMKTLRAKIDARNHPAPQRVIQKVKVIHVKPKRRKRPVKLKPKVVRKVHRDVLKEVKKSMSKKFKSRGKKIDEVLRSDLQRREDAFKDKRSVLIKEFNLRKKELENKLRKKYAMRVKTSLHDEISHRFNTELQKKLDSEKTRLNKLYLANLKKHADEQLKRQQLHEKLKNELARRVKGMEEGFRKRQERIELERKKEKAKISGEKQTLKKLKSSLEKQKRSKARVLKRLGRTEKNLSKDKQDFDAKKNREVEKIKKRLAKKFHRDLENHISLREEKIRVQMRKDFEESLRKHLKAHRNDLQKKRSKLESNFNQTVGSLLK